MKTRLGLVSALLLACGVLGQEARAAELVSHRATYTMSLRSAATGSGIVGARGLMIYEFADACDGWTVSNNTALALASSDGGEVETTWSFVTWESKDGSKYRFRVNGTRNGEVSEDIQGSAFIRKDGTGQVEFAKPEPQKVALPKNSMFPTMHTVKLLESARAKDKMFSRVVFDGASMDGPFEVAASIGGTLGADKPGHGSPLLEKSPSWRMQLSFFPAKSKEATPSYEIRLRYHDNGIAQDVIQDFGNFSVDAKLDKLERLKKSGC